MSNERKNLLSLVFATKTGLIVISATHPEVGKISDMIKRELPNLDTAVRLALDLNVINPPPNPPRIPTADEDEEVEVAAFDMAELVLKNINLLPIIPPVVALVDATVSKAVADYVFEINNGHQESILVNETTVLSPSPQWILDYSTITSKPDCMALSLGRFATDPVEEVSKLWNLNHFILKHKDGDNNPFSSEGAEANASEMQAFNPIFHLSLHALQELVLDKGISKDVFCGLQEHLLNEFCLANTSIDFANINRNCLFKTSALQFLPGLGDLKARFIIQKVYVEMLHNSTVYTISQDASDGQYQAKHPLQVYLEPLVGGNVLKNLLPFVNFLPEHVLLGKFISTHITTDNWNSSKNDDWKTGQNDEWKTSENDEWKTGQNDEWKTGENDDWKTSENDDWKTSENDEWKTSQNDEWKTNENDEWKTSENDECKTCENEESAAENQESTTPSLPYAEAPRESTITFPACLLVSSSKKMITCTVRDMLNQLLLLETNDDGNQTRAELDLLKMFFINTLLPRTSLDVVLQSLKNASLEEILSRCNEQSIDDNVITFLIPKNSILAKLDGDQEAGNLFCREDFLPLVDSIKRSEECQLDISEDSEACFHCFYKICPIDSPFYKNAVIKCKVANGIFEEVCSENVTNYPDVSVKTVISNIPGTFNTTAPDESASYYNAYRVISNAMGWWNQHDEVYCRFLEVDYKNRQLLLSVEGPRDNLVNFECDNNKSIFNLCQWEPDFYPHLYHLGKIASQKVTETSASYRRELSFKNLEDKTGETDEIPHFVHADWQGEVAGGQFAVWRLFANEKKEPTKVTFRYSRNQQCIVLSIKCKPFPLSDEFFTGYEIEQQIKNCQFSEQEVEMIRKQNNQKIRRTNMDWVSTFHLTRTTVTNKFCLYITPPTILHGVSSTNNPNHPIYKFDHPIFVDFDQIKHQFVEPYLKFRAEFEANSKFMPDDIKNEREIKNRLRAKKRQDKTIAHYYLGYRRSDLGSQHPSIPCLYWIIPGGVDEYIRIEDIRIDHHGYRISFCNLPFMTKEDIKLDKINKYPERFHYSSVNRLLTDFFTKPEGFRARMLVYKEKDKRRVSE